MPLFTHQCEHCGHSEQVLTLASSHAPVWPECPTCDDGGMPRVEALARRYTGVFEKPVEMLSIALDNDDQIRGFRERNPETQISTDRRDPDYGVPMARTRQEKLRILSNEGFMERS